MAKKNRAREATAKVAVPKEEVNWKKYDELLVGGMDAEDALEAAKK